VQISTQNFWRTYDGGKNQVENSKMDGNIVLPMGMHYNQIKGNKKDHTDMGFLAYEVLVRI